jgi:signal transduction histidine kinase/ActR/RegA family two-component response regulator
MSRLSAANGAPPVRQDFRNGETLSAQVRLLYASAHVGVAVTVIASTVLGYLEWGIASRIEVLCWWIYMILVSLWRFTLARRYGRDSGADAEAGRWRTAFAVGAGLAGAGWGAAGFFLYQEAHLANQVVLIFVLGGMMLGAASLLAARPEAFLAFLIPTGLAPTARLLFEGDESHLVMGLLTAVFTLATLVTTLRIYRTIDSSIRLQFENRELVEDLRAAKTQTEALNEALELRVRERTAELHHSTEQLKAEIAQRKNMEEELIRARKLESLGVLAGGIAHDFNNFLTVVQGNIEVAKLKLGDPGHPIQEILDQASSTCRRAAFLSSQLLTFAKGGAPVRRLVSVGKLVLDAVQLARAGTPTSITVDIAEDLYFAKVDPGQIGQVLHNILLNAQQAMPQGGIIEVSAANFTLSDSAVFDPRVRISIRDYGCGIPADVLPRIFDPYFTTKRGGNGLGLATAYSIIAKHDGHIFVESEPGEGTEFIIDLPACRESPAPESPIVVDFQTGKERILVMDDEEALRKLLEAVLGNLGYETVTARDGAEAIALYEAAKAAGRCFDAVLLDLTVSGGMGGTEAAAKLREIDPAAKLIVSSGYSDATVMSEFARYGFEAVLPKPWTALDVSQVLRSVLVVHPDRKPD